MNIDLLELIRQRSAPFEPLATGHPPQLKKLSGIRAILLDIYGTLVVSGSGDVEASDPQTCHRAIEEALAEQQIQATGKGALVYSAFRAAIEQRHRELRAEAIDYPEIEIRDLWRDVLKQVIAQGQIEADLDAIDIQQLAITYECLANRVWPMPDLAEFFSRLQQSGLPIGFLSNAQFFTPMLFPALLDKTLESLGVDERLQFYSYRYSRAKPSISFYSLAVEALAHRGISPDEVIYMGNDMLNDIAPAGEVGFRTALFAGDRRSLRLRQGDPRVEGTRADLTVTNLLQLLDCLEPWDTASDS